MKIFGKIALTTAAAAAALTFGLAGTASAEFPEKPVNYIIAFKPGGESDVTARFQQPFFKKMFGQDLVMSYKDGGGGAVAWAQLNGMAGDGYTIMGTNLPHIVIQPAQKDVGYTTDELINIHWFHYTPDAIVVKSDSEFKTLKDLIDFAKANPGKVTFSGSGKGSANHLAQVTFDRLAGIKSTYVAFAGTAPSTTAVLGGQVVASWGYTTVPPAYAGTRMLAVAMDKRHPNFPDVPTFKELGFDLVSGAYRGIAVPKSTPEPLRQKLGQMFQQINDDPSFVKQMEDNGFAMINAPYGPELDKFMAKAKNDILTSAKEAGIVK
ncbi:MAG: tripartite tricarboxylate transporter substrate binding protein [Rhodospirillales bacterium]|jgi:tripartite-type tricarboxylate transporter receptor subunit TctC|nr:tripartite tricarboxylate transporter substrate binding protein [Rhodospirillales bacterium]